MANRITPGLAMTLAILPFFIAAKPYDVAIVGGQVIDPQSGLNAVRNVAIEGNKIVLVTEQVLDAKKIINAQGMIVSPGFIDMHAHGQSILAGRVQALDGVTTALELEAGVLPVADYYTQAANQGRAINYGASVNWANARISVFLNIPPENDSSWFEQHLAQQNWQREPANAAQRQQILNLVEQGIQQGGLGVGFLLGYAPGTGLKEYYEVSRLAAVANLPTFTHARFLSMLEPKSSFEGMAEIIAVAAGTGVHAHIVHLNSISLRDIDIIGPMISSAQTRNINITTEAYPYGAGSTSIGSAMFRGEHWRERVGGISAHNFDLAGHRLSEEEFATLQRDKPETEVVIHLLDTDNSQDLAYLDKSVLFPGGVIASDGMPWLAEGKSIEPSTWPMPDNAWSHPRSAGTFSRFLRQYVRERKKLSWSDAIERLSYGPARILQDAIPQMRFKGRLQAGADADIVVFDPQTVSDKATFSQPAQTSAGHRYVLVNGEILVAEGELNTQVLPGQAIRNTTK